VRPQSGTPLFEGRGFINSWCSHSAPQVAKATLVSAKRSLVAFATPGEGILVHHKVIGAIPVQGLLHNPTSQLLLEVTNHATASLRRGAGSCPAR